MLSLHVSGGVAGLLLGGFALNPFGQGWIRRAYAGALLVLAVFLSGTVALDWPALGTRQRVIYPLLIALAVVVVLRAVMALQLEQSRTTGWEGRYVGHVYFTYISLWEALFIVGLIDAGAPIWLVVVVAIGLVILGATLISAYRKRLSSRPAAT